MIASGRGHQENYTRIAAVPPSFFERNRVGLVTGFHASLGRTEDVLFAEE